MTDNGFLIVYWTCCGVITGLNTYWIIKNLIEIKRLDKENKRLDKLLRG